MTKFEILTLLILLSIQTDITLIYLYARKIFREKNRYITFTDYTRDKDNPIVKIYDKEKKEFIQ